MRSTSTLLALACAPFLLGSPLSAQDPATDSPPAPAVDVPPVPGTPPAPETGAEASKELPESIKKMSQEERQKLSSLLQDASTYLSGIRIQEAFEKLVEAEAMAPDFAPVFNLKGAGYTKLREFDKAAAAFAKAIELDPSVFMARFNHTEVLFVSKKFEKAAAEFSALREKYPDMPEETLALLDLKILICRLMTDDEPGAMKILDGFSFLDDHPGYYFANAALHYSREENEEAQSWIRSAKRIYPPSQVNIFTDSLIEVGWIERLQ